jgi:hypothetical protein
MIPVIIIFLDKVELKNRNNMNTYKINYNNMRNKTTPQNVKEANEGLFYSKMNLPSAAEHCGMTLKEMKLTFFEYLKYHPLDHF